jgi:hypothetical protein
VDYAYRIADPLPSAHLVSRLHVAGSDLEALNLLIRPGFRPENEAVVSDLPTSWQDAQPDVPSPGAIESVARESDHVRIAVAAARSALLVLNDTYFPGWEARVDGVPSRIYRTNVFVRGVVVPPGTHVVELVYRPASFRIGASISIGSLLLAVGLLAGAVRQASSTRTARPRAEPRPIVAEET